MAKPKLITRTIRLLRDAPVVTLSAGGQYDPKMEGEVPEYGDHIVIPVADAEAHIRECIREDARTRVDPSKRKKAKRKVAK